MESIYSFLITRASAAVQVPIVRLNISLRILMKDFACFGISVLSFHNRSLVYEYGNKYLFYVILYCIFEFVLLWLICADFY